MADEYIGLDEGIKRLEGAIEVAGSLKALCLRIGVSGGAVSPMRTGERRITGKVAVYLGLVPTYAYRLNVNSADPRQVQYENDRRAWAEQRGNPIIKPKGIRV
jgi:predicted aspartyl protease